MIERLWQPERGLERIHEKGVGGHHVLVRKTNIELFRSAIWRGVVAAYQRGKPLPPPPNLPTIWVGDLRNFEASYGPDFGTAYILEAPIIRNHGFPPEDMFKEDGLNLTEEQKAGVFPLIVVTEASYTRRWDPKASEHKEVDPDFLDPDGPNKIQNICLDMGVAVLRITKEELPTKIQESMRALHLGERHPQITIPSTPPPPPSSDRVLQPSRHGCDLNRD